MFCLFHGENNNNCQNYHRYKRELAKIRKRDKQIITRWQRRYCPPEVTP